MDKKIRLPAKASEPLKIVDFLQAAFDDYLAARVLIRSRLLPQGAVVASTALEKYCKAILAFRGQNSRGHLKMAHWNCLQNFDNKLYQTFNKEFFLFLQKCYNLRYLDDLPIGFNIAIHSRELLAELDFTALSLQQKFKIRSPEKTEPGKMQYEEMILNKDDRLIGDNYFLNSENRADFIARDNQMVYELRKLTNGALLKISYIALPIHSDGQFMREGLKPKDDKKSFDLSAAPGTDKMAEAICKNCGMNWIEHVIVKDNKLTFLDQAPISSFSITWNTATGELVNLIFLECKNCKSKKITEQI